eukprot:s1917_g18.t1
MLKGLMISFALIGLNPLVFFQVDMYAVDTLPMETEAATEVASPHVAASMVPQHGPHMVPQQMAQPVPHFQPAVSPATQASLVHMPAEPVQPLAVPAPPLPDVAPLQPPAAPVTVSEPMQPLTLAPAVPNQSAQPAAPGVVMQPLTLAPQPAEPAAAVVKPAHPTPAPPMPNGTVAPQPAQQPAAPVVNAQPLNLAPGVPNEIPQPAAPVGMDKPVQPFGLCTCNGSHSPSDPARAAFACNGFQPKRANATCAPHSAAPVKPVLQPAVALQPRVPATPPMVVPVVQQSQQQKPDVAAAEAKKKEQEQADKDLQAMGWLTRSCRPRASPHGTSAPAGKAENADALRRLKSQVFTPPPEASQTGPIAAPPQAAAAVKSQQFGTPQLVAPQSAKPQAMDAEYTKKQMQDAYGEDADKVMKYKVSIGMTEDDENCPDGVVYLVAQREDEEDDYTRSGTEDDENCPDGVVYLVAQREDEEDDYTRSGWDVLRNMFQEHFVGSSSWHDQIAWAEFMPVLQ